MRFWIMVDGEFRGAKLTQIACARQLKAVSAKKQKWQLSACRRTLSGKPEARPQMTLTQVPLLFYGVIFAPCHLWEADRR
jgi:hypothetical protein